MKKWLYYLLVGMYMDKVKIFCDHSMTLREMTDNLPASGHFWTPPASFRVKNYQSNRKFQILLFFVKNSIIDIVLWLQNGFLHHISTCRDMSEKSIMFLLIYCINLHHFRYSCHCGTLCNCNTHGPVLY